MAIKIFVLFAVGVKKKLYRSPEKEPALTNCEEIAHAIGRSKKTVRRLSRLGLIPCIRVSKRLHLYSRSAVLKALHSFTERPQ